MTYCSFEGREYFTIEDAEITGRVFNDPDLFEMCAIVGTDDSEDRYFMYWIFEDEDQDLDMYDYDEVDRVEII